MTQPIVAPSILAADFTRLGEEIEMVNRSEGDWIHFDVMDGHFVPNISFGLPVLASIKAMAKKPLDVHLMIANPELYLEAFRDAGADHISVHIEATHHIDRLLNSIKDMGLKAGIAINPGTPVSSLTQVIHLADIVCVMSVNPGFGGQSFIPYIYDKVGQLKDLILTRGSATLIEIDGGVNRETAPKLLAVGADVLVAGSYVFKAEKPTETIASLKQLSSQPGKWV